MNNYYSQYEEPYNPQECYPNTYNLWQNSQYYDINNLSPQNCASQVWGNPEPCGSKDEVPIKTDRQKKRIISRESLYKDPQNNIPLSAQAIYKFGSSGPNWTNYYWPKESEPIQGWSRKANVHKAGKMQRKLKAALAHPIKLGKAESMMQRMGWQGGALGKTGAGIIEPIAPNAAYATQTIGFGQFQTQIKPKQNGIFVENRDHFNTNVLLCILEFVKSEVEIEMAFDSKLWKVERKQVHCLVNDLINGDDMTDFANSMQMDIVKQIHDYNCYVLTTQSDGLAPNRQLYIYKEAPPHVYLITPDDLRDDDDVDPTEDTQENDQEPDKATNMDVDESNPFLKSITRHLKQENISSKLENCNIDSNKTDGTVLDTVVEYFTDFSDQNEFTEFRFLGPFSGEEIDLVNEFLSELYKCMNMSEDDSATCRQDLVQVFQNGGHFGYYEDVNGSTVIYKMKMRKYPRSYY